MPEQTTNRKKIITVKQNGNVVRLDEEAITNLFHQLYYYSAEKTWQNTFWFGLPVLKNPFDMWIYQEIIYEIQPDIIIETGTYFGGSALYMALMCDALGTGRIITIDVTEHKQRQSHPRVQYMLGSSTSEEIVTEVKKIIDGKKKVMVILDSDHSKNHVLKELKIYSQFVSLGSYLVVEDTNINGHPVRPNWGAGPMEALEEFMQTAKDFVVDKSKEKFLFTQNPKGFLKKV